jgi:DNA-binding IclR family transcriptional regulator
LGKAILSFLPENERQQILNEYVFRPLTPFTITDKDQFLHELSVICQRGYAIDEQENELGGRCVGAPILDRYGYPIAAISISVPIPRFPEEDIVKYGKKLVSTAEIISQKMGHAK